MMAMRDSEEYSDDDEEWAPTTTAKSVFSRDKTVIPHGQHCQDDNDKDNNDKMNAGTDMEGLNYEVKISEEEEEEVAVEQKSSFSWSPPALCFSKSAPPASLLAVGKSTWNQMIQMYKEATTSTTDTSLHLSLRRHLEHFTTAQLQEVLWTHLHISLARTPRDWNRMVSICEELLRPVASQVLSEAGTESEITKRSRMRSFLLFRNTREEEAQREARIQQLWQFHCRQEAARSIQRAFLHYRKMARRSKNDEEEGTLVPTDSFAHNNDDDNYMTNPRTRTMGNHDAFDASAPPLPPVAPVTATRRVYFLPGAPQSFESSSSSLTGSNSWTEDESLTSFGSCVKRGATAGSFSNLGQGRESEHEPFQRVTTSTLSSTSRLLSHIDVHGHDKKCAIAAPSTIPRAEMMEDERTTPQREKGLVSVTQRRHHQKVSQAVQNRVPPPVVATAHATRDRVRTLATPTTQQATLAQWKRWSSNNRIIDNFTLEADDDDSDDDDMRPNIAPTYHWWTTSTGRYCLRGGWSEQFDFWKERHASDFALVHGSALSNYFKFLKWCGLVIFVLLCIYLPMLVVNSWGTRLYAARTERRTATTTTATPTNSWMLGTTLGNLGESDLVFSVAVPWCDKQMVSPLRTCILDKDNIAFFYSVLDVLAVLWVTLAWMWLMDMERAEQEQAQDSPMRPLITVSDYTLWIPHLRNCVSPCQETPPVSAADFQRHFERLFARHDSKMRVVKVQLPVSPKEERPWCCLVHHDLRSPRSLLGRRQVCRVANCSPLVQQGCHDDEEEGKLPRWRSAQNLLTKPPRPLPHGAFVTFDTMEGLVRALSEYRRHEWKPTWLYPRRLLLGGHVRLERVRQAPDPSAIHWHNMTRRHSSLWSVRRLLAVLGGCFLLFPSVGCTLGAWHLFEDTFQERKLGAGVCPLDFDEASEPVQRDWLREEQEHNGAMSKTLTHCYCRQLSTLAQWEDPLCYRYVRSAWFTSLVMSLAAVIVCLVNSPLLTWWVNKVVVEHCTFPVTMEQQETSRWLWLFGWEWINSASLILLLPPLLEGGTPLLGVHWYEKQGMTLLWIMVFRIFTPHLQPLVQYARHIATLRRRLQPSDSLDDTSSLSQPPMFQVSIRYAQSMVTFHLCWMYALAMPILAFWGTLSFVVTFWVDKFLCCHFYRLPSVRDGSGDDGGRLCRNRVMGLSIALHLFMSLVFLGPRQVFSGHPMVVTTALGGRDGGRDSLQVRFTPWDEYIFVQHLVLLQVLLLTIVLGFVVVQCLQWAISCCLPRLKGQRRRRRQRRGGYPDHKKPRDSHGNNEELDDDDTALATAMEQNPWAAEVSFTRAQERGILYGPTSYEPLTTGERNLHEAPRHPEHPVGNVPALLPNAPGDVWSDNQKAAGPRDRSDDNSVDNDTEDGDHFETCEARRESCALRHAFRRGVWDTRGVSSVTLDTV